MASSPFLTLLLLLIGFVHHARATFSVTGVSECGRATVIETAALEEEGWDAIVLFTGQAGVIENFHCTGPSCTWLVDLPAGADIDVCSSLATHACVETVVSPAPPSANTNCLASNPGANAAAILAEAAALAGENGGNSSESSGHTTATTVSSTSSTPLPKANNSTAPPPAVPTNTGLPPPSGGGGDEKKHSSNGLAIAGGLLGAIIALALIGFAAYRLHSAHRRRARQAAVARAVYSPYFLASDSGGSRPMSEASGTNRRSGDTRASRRQSWRRDRDLVSGLSDVPIGIDIDVTSDDAHAAPPAFTMGAAAFFAGATAGRAEEEKSAERYAALGMGDGRRDTVSSVPSTVSHLSSSSTLQPPPTATTVHRPPSYATGIESNRPPSYESDGSRRTLVVSPVPTPANFPAPPSAIPTSPEAERGRRIPPPVWRGSHA